MPVLYYIILEPKGYQITASAYSLSFGPGRNIVSMSAKLLLVPSLGILTVAPSRTSLLCDKIHYFVYVSEYTLAY